MKVNNVLFPSRESFFDYQREYYCPAIDHLWNLKRAKLLEEAKSKEVNLAGDAR